jgi:hypothetical protein
MKSIIPFNIVTSNNAINKFLLNGGNGLEKGDILNIYYNDTVGKREIIYELLLSTLLPKEWGQGDEPKQIAEGQELGAILIDI